MEGKKQEVFPKFSERVLNEILENQKKLIDEREKKIRESIVPKDTDPEKLKAIQEMSENMWKYHEHSVREIMGKKRQGKTTLWKL